MIERKLIILGSGPAGLTAAIYAARANLEPLVIRGPLPGGQLTTTTEVENFPGFRDGIMGPELMIQMEEQAKRFGAEFSETVVREVSLQGGKKILKTSDEKTYLCSALIVATGATPRLLGIPNERDLMGYGVSTCATCDGAFFKGKKIAVVGGGDSACEESNFLSRYGEKVYLIHRRGELRASKIMAERVKNNPKIEILWNKEVEGIKGDKKNGVTEITLKSTTGEPDLKLACSALFVAIGHTPNSALFRGILEMDEAGYVVKKPDSTTTNVSGIFVCGDVADHVFRQAVTAAGTGCMAAMEAERWLSAGND
ncbi:MAG TPA: thioredoxin-disulfide reductase [Oligoflexia bacterium]|nr:thioredoxin-disulfide reductase [Oligoflexia bacterium]HMP26894.1 thioredoxin-disulfide reductase [Oligoflexia bacterium]